MAVIERIERGPESAATTSLFVLATIEVSTSAPRLNSQRAIRDALAGGAGQVVVMTESAAHVNHALTAMTQTTRAQQPDPAPDTDAPRLTQREREVLALAAKGLHTSEIADLLEISCHTANTHLKRIYRKLNCRSRGEAVFEATRIGLIHTP